MKKRTLTEIKTEKSTLDAFGGYDHRIRISEGKLYDDCNLTARHYPVMATRDERLCLASINRLCGVHAKETLAWIADRRLYYGGKKVEGPAFSDLPKTIVSMGANLVIYPDMIRYNTKTGDWERLFCADDGGKGCSSVSILPEYTEAIASSAKRYSSLPDGDPVVFQNVWVEDETSEEGGYYESRWEVDTAYEPTEGSYAYVSRRGWDDVEQTDRFFVYRKGVFVPLETDRITVRYEYETRADASARGQKMASVTGLLRLWAGMDDSLLCRIESVNTVTNDSAHIPYAVYLRLSVPKEMNEVSRVTDSRLSALDWAVDYPRTPFLDGIIENGNRLWGWRFGEAMNGEWVNEIYATALGDPKGWNVLEGIASDSYAAQVGSDGPFTGAAYFSGSMYFFKETGFHRVMGQKQSNFQVTFFTCNGVEQGSESSLVLHGDALYYKGVDGIYCYDGSIPYKISSEFGDLRYRNAVAGTTGDRIYFEMEGVSGGKQIFVYDVARRLWHKENALGVLRFVPAFGSLLYLTDGALGLMSCEGVDETFFNLFPSCSREGALPWFAEFGDFGISDLDAKYLSRMRLRMTAERSARICAEIMCDSDGSWRTASVFSVKEKQTVSIPLVVPRCDHFRLRLSGEGGFRLWAMIKEIERTGEI